MEVSLNQRCKEPIEEAGQSGMSKNGMSRAEGPRRIGSDPMRWFQAGFLVAALSVTGLAQEASKKPDTPAAERATPAEVQTSAAQQSGASSQTGAGAVDNARYVIGSDDSLTITVWKEPTLSGTLPVRPDGMVSMALIGDIPAAGRTPMQLSDEITAKLKKYVQDPNVSVVVMAVNSQRIFLIGEVGHVGPVAMTPGMSPLQAIASGGGLSPYAKSKKIYILRNESGKQQKIPFNYKQALKGDTSENVTLKPGDTIVVP